MLLIEDGDAQIAGPVPPAHKRYALPVDDDVAKEYFTPDVAAAKQLLEAASWDFDHEIVLRHSNRPGDAELAQVLKEQFARGDVKVKLEQQDLVRWFSQTLNQGDFEATCFQHLAYEDPDLPLRFYMADPQSGISNFMGYDEAKVTQACLDAASELNEEARVEKVYEAQRVIMREYAPMFNIYSKMNFSGRYAYVKGGIVGRGSLGLFNRTTWLDK
jgi:ABC-type transport system substrate-binding protein